MSKYVENNLQKGETIVKKAKITMLFAFMHITNILIIPLIVRLVKVKNIALAFTNKRIVGKVGVIKTQALDAPLNKIQNCSVKQGLGGKIFNYGTIRVDTAAGKFEFVGVKDANGFKNALMAQTDKFEEDRMQQQASQMAQAMAGVLNR